MRTAWIAAIALVLACTPGKADSCSDIKLPAQIQQQLATTFAGWTIVVPSLLEESDRETWLDCCSRECPGIIRGRFTDKEEGYVLNLVRRRRGKNFQQVVYFRPAKNGFHLITIYPSSVVGQISVARKRPAGTYRGAEDGHSITAKRDVISCEVFGAGEIIYYWDGARFRSIITSM